MPYQVATETTPLWADHQRTRKNGKVLLGKQFRWSEEVVDGGLVMWHVIGELMCSDGHMDGGWLEAKNCAKVEPAGSTAVSTTGGIPVVFGKKQYLITIEEVQ